MKAAGIGVTEGVLRHEAQKVTLGHVLRITQGRPAVTLKLAVGSDGLVPRGERGAPTWVTGELARAHAHLLRARSDAILVGRGTIMADNPSLTCLPLAWNAGRRCGLSWTGACARRPTRACSRTKWCRSGWSALPTKSRQTQQSWRNAAPRSFRLRSIPMAFPRSGRCWSGLQGAASRGFWSKGASRGARLSRCRPRR